MTRNISPEVSFLLTTFRAAARPARSFSVLLILILTIPDALADYRVTRSLYLQGMSAAESECGSNNIADQCAPGDITSSAKSLSGNATVGAYTGMSSASLYTGDLKIKATGPTYQTAINTEMMDRLDFSSTIAPGTFQVIPVDITLDGTYRDGSSISFSASFLSGSYGGIGDYLNVDASYTGNGQAANTADPVSSTQFDLADSCTTCFSNFSGTWSTQGPTHFLGEYKVYGDNPIVIAIMSLSGSGYFDLSNTASIRFILPTGVSFTSDSGVFLSAVPVPTALPLLISGLIGLGWIGRRRTAAWKA